MTAGTSVVMVLLSIACPGGAGWAQELLGDPSFAAGTPTPALKGWVTAGGAVQPPAGTQAGAVLTPERTVADGAEIWRGRLMTRDAIEVLPGRRYRFKCEARGQGTFRIGVAEYGSKHSVRLLGSVEDRVDLSAEARQWSLEYVPTGDGVACVKPYVQIEGWLNRAELRSASFTAVPGTGTVTLLASHFLATPGSSLPLTLDAPSYPVKLLLYGPSGESGPGGPSGGSGAFSDHFKTSFMQEGMAGKPVTVALPIAPEAIEGAYRLVVVDPASGASGVTRFNVMPEPGARELLDLVGRLSIPKGTRWVFLGDSLTANFPGRNYVSLLDRALRWRFGEGAEVINAGVGGNTIAAMAARLESDVIDKKPTRVFIFEGANSCKRPYRPATGQLGGWALPEPAYEAAWRDVLTRLTQRNIAVVVMTMAPGEREILDAMEATARAFGEARNFWCDPETVRRVVALQKRLAAEFGADVIDVNAHLLAHMQERARRGGHQYLHVDDGVHLGEYGSREVAKAILRHVAGQ